MIPSTTPARTEAHRLCDRLDYALGSANRRGQYGGLPGSDATVSPQAWRALSRSFCTAKRCAKSINGGIPIRSIWRADDLLRADRSFFSRVSVADQQQEQAPGGMLAVSMITQGCAVRGVLSSA